MIEHFPNAVWMETTAPLWTAIALIYGFAAIYQRALSHYEYPWWTWGTLLAISGTILMLVNRRFFFHVDSSLVQTIEYLSMLTIATVGFVLIYAFAQYAKEKNTRERIQNALEDHGIDPEDIDIETPD